MLWYKKTLIIGDNSIESVANDGGLNKQNVLILVIENYF